MPRKFVWETPEEINIGIAKRVKNIRNRRKISQIELSELSGVSYGSIKRFETTGDISLKSLTRIALALNMVDDLKRLFSDIGYLNIQEVVNENR
ncbi:MAG: helix-turn-helix transcriptional regulator [Lachnospiraceae bacterium]|nr:helix-turn-helix transcriptional regulator [Lachnospiraceae bacterium]